MRSTLAFVLAACVCGVANSSLGEELLWMNLADGNSTSRNTMITSGSSTYDGEVADDFDVEGNIERVLMSGYGCFSCGGHVVEDRLRSSPRSQRIWSGRCGSCRRIRNIAGVIGRAKTGGPPGDPVSTGT